MGMEKNFELIQKFFENLKCSHCDNYFDKGAVQPVRKEESNVVVRITCLRCGKNLGLAILGIDKGEYKNSLKFQDEYNNSGELDFMEDPITYDDVAEAHRFFSGLGPDWMKHLPKDSRE